MAAPNLNYAALWDAYNPGWGLHVTSPFGQPRIPDPHAGADWSLGPNLSAGVPVVAAAGGVVKFIGNAHGYGKWVVVETTLPDGTVIRTTYGHVVGSDGLQPGSTVSAGQIIGHIGSKSELLAGWSQAEINDPNNPALSRAFTGPHLHSQMQYVSTGGGLTPFDPTTFTGWQGQPHAVGTNYLGNAFIATNAPDGTETITLTTPTGDVIYSVATAPIFDSTRSQRYRSRFLSSELR